MVDLLPEQFKTGLPFPCSPLWLIATPLSAQVLSLICTTGSTLIFTNFLYFLYFVIIYFSYSQICISLWLMAPHAQMASLISSSGFPLICTISRSSSLQVSPGSSIPRNRQPINSPTGPAHAHNNNQITALCHKLITDMGKCWSRTSWEPGAAAGKNLQVQVQIRYFYFWICSGWGWESNGPKSFSFGSKVFLSSKLQELVLVLEFDLLL